MFSRRKNSNECKLYLPSCLVNVSMENLQGIPERFNAAYSNNDSLNYRDVINSLLLMSSPMPTDDEL
jgi:hypothetical protein